MATVNVALIVRATVIVPDEAPLLADATNETDNLLRFAANLAERHVTGMDMNDYIRDFVTIDGVEVADSFFSKEDV